MTIAAGFIVQEGILICADTQITGGAKTNKPKIQPFTLNDGTLLIFALAGHPDYGQMGIEDSLEAIEGIPPDKRSPTRIKLAIRNVLVDINRVIDSSPEREQDAFRFDLLIALHRQPDPPRLYITRRTSIRRVNSRECIGIGEYLAEYLLGHHERSASMKKTLILATQMLYALKRYDANCGGFSHFAILLRNGELRQQQWHITEAAEHQIPKFEGWAAHLLSLLSDPTVTDNEFATELDHFITAMKRLKQYWREQIENYQRLEQFLNFIDNVKSPQ